MRSVPSPAASLLTWVASAAVVLFVLGVSRPALTVERFFFFRDSYSIWGGIVVLWHQGEWALALLLLTFSVCFPALKLSLLLLCVLRPGMRPRLLHGASLLSRWSMADVLVLALLVVSVKSGGLIEASVGDGAYFFAGSVALTGVAFHLALRRGLDPRVGAPLVEQPV